MNNDNQFSIQLTGSRLSFSIVMSGMATLIAAIVFATVWMTKLDDRVLINAVDIADNASVLVEERAVLKEIQRINDKQSHVLDVLIKRVDKNDIDTRLNTEHRLTDQ